MVCIARYTREEENCSLRSRDNILRDYSIFFESIARSARGKVNARSARGREHARSAREEMYGSLRSRKSRPMLALLAEEYTARYAREEESSARYRSLVRSPSGRLPRHSLSHD